MKHDAHHPHLGHARGGRECHGAENGPRVHGFLIPCILQMLSAGPAHGYRLMEILSQRSYVSPLPDPGVLYRHLRNLEKNALVSSTLEQGGGPARRVYAITDSGRDCLADWVDGFRRLQSELAAFIADASTD